MTTQHSPLLWLQSYFFYSIFVLPLPNFVMEKPKPEKVSGDSPRNQIKSVNPSAEFNERKFNLLGGDRRGGALMILWRCSLLLASTPPYPRRELRISSLFSSHSHSFFLQLGASQSSGAPNYYLLAYPMRADLGRLLSNIFTLLGFLADNRLFLLKKAFRVVILGIFL